MKFVEYLWYLAHRPLKMSQQEDSDIYKFFKATGKILDEAKEKIFLLRRQALIALASGKGLDKHGRDRKLKRYAGEDDEQYRKRVLAKPEIAKMAGTKKGILQALKSLGYENATIEPAYTWNKTENQEAVWYLDGNHKLNGNYKLDSINFDTSRWAEFMLFLNTDNEESLDNFDIVQKVVRKVKQGSSLPVYGWRMDAVNNDTEICEAKLTTYLYWNLDGNYNLNGAKTLGEEINEEVI